MQILQQRNTELLTLGWRDFEQFLNEAVLDWIFVQSMTNQLKTINPIVVLSGQSISSWYFSFSNQSKEHKATSEKTQFHLMLRILANFSQYPLYRKHKALTPNL